MRMSWLWALLLLLTLFFQVDPSQGATSKHSHTSAVALELNSKVIEQLPFQSSSSQVRSGFVQLKNYKIYVEFLAPEAGKPFFVLTNGLVYDLNRWSVFKNEFISRGYGFLNYYFRGQHLTLKKEVEEKITPAFFANGLSSKDFADELNELTQVMGIPAPFHLIALSYGSTIAAEFAQYYPEKVDKLVFLAPLVVSLDRYSPQGKWVLNSLDMLKFWWGPFLGPMFYEAAYRQIYSNYFSSRIVPENTPEELKDMAPIYKESLFHLVRAARDFDLRTINFSNMGVHSVNFMLANEDDQKFYDDQMESFDNLPKKQQGVLIWNTMATHAIPESDGVRAIRFLDFLFNNDKRIQAGLKYKLTENGLENWK